VRGVTGLGAYLLRPAGVLAVALPPTRNPGEPAATVAGAAGGLGYLQHVVALLQPLHEDHLDPHGAASRTRCRPWPGW
jgi:hypothetical protein